MAKDNLQYITHISSSIKDGGMARNDAFFKYFEKKGATIINVFSKNIFIRLFKTLKIVFLLFFYRNKTLFIHQGTLFYLFPTKIFKNRFFFKYIFLLLERASLRNRLTVEVNDLPYEQSIDLGLTIQPFYLDFEKKLFSLKEMFFVFASNLMEAYVKEKFSLVNTRTVINGGNELKRDKKLKEFDWENTSFVKFIYAGTLNKGRQIEDLLNFFKGKENVILILIGTEGDWILEDSSFSNILYLGNFEEEIAHHIVSKCDLGIIPYYSDVEFYKFLQNNYSDKSTFFLGGNFGPYKDDNYYKSFHNIFSKATDVCFREEASYKMFEDLDNIRYSSDIVFGLKRKEIPKIQKSVGFSIVGPFKYIREIDEELYINKYVELIDYYVNNKYTIRIFSFAEKEGDLAIIKKIYEKIKDTSKIEIINYEGNLDLFLNKYQEMESVYCGRFHAMILSMLFKQNIYPVVYSKKMTNVLNDIGYNGEVIDFFNFHSIDVEYSYNQMIVNKYNIDKEIMDSENHFKILDKFLS